MSFSFIKWNFTKFLVDKNGEPVKRYSPNTEPLVSDSYIFVHAWICCFEKLYIIYWNQLCLCVLLFISLLPWWHLLSHWILCSQTDKWYVSSLSSSCLDYLHLHWCLKSSKLYLLNCGTLCNQTWYAGAFLWSGACVISKVWVAIFKPKVTQWRLESSVNVCPSYNYLLNCELCVTKQAMYIFAD